MSKKIRYKPGKAQARMGLVMGILFIILGVTLVIPMTFQSGIPAIGLFGIVWTAIAVYNTVINAKVLSGKTDEEMYGSYEVTETRSRPSGPAVPAGGEGEHDHISSVSLNAKERLEQLEHLKGAGLLTNEEYRIKREEILRDL